MESTFIKEKLSNILLTGSLLFVTAASFLPYSIELFLGLSVICLLGCIYGIPDDVKLIKTAVLSGAGLSLVLFLILIFNHKLHLYLWIQTFILICIGMILAWKIQEKKILYRILTGLLCLFVSLGVYSHAFYSRSIMATAAEWILASQKVPQEQIVADFEALTRAGETKFVTDTSTFDKEFIEIDFQGMPVLILNADTDYKQVIFYLHGGYYVHQMIKQQIEFINRLANETESMIVIPIYPLAPFHTVEENYDIMMKLYEKVSLENGNKKMVLMGDSAGGGYSLALAEGFKEQNISQPDELILICPWVDVTMENPDIKEYVDADPRLTVTKAKLCAEAWAGNLDLEDWHVSPIYGDLSYIKNVSIFVGTREIFYPDDTLLYEKLKDAPNTALYIGKGLNHVYPVYPIIEGRMAVEQIKEIIAR